MIKYSPRFGSALFQYNTTFRIPPPASKIFAFKWAGVGEGDTRGAEGKAPAIGFLCGCELRAKFECIPYVRIFFFSSTWVLLFSMLSKYRKQEAIRKLFRFQKASGRSL